VFAYRQLLTQGEVLEGERAGAAEEEGKDPKEMQQERNSSSRDCVRIGAHRSTTCSPAKVWGRTRTVLAGNVGSAKRLSYAWSATPSPGLAHPAADEGLRCRHPGQWHEARPARRRHHARAAGGHPGEGRSEEVDGFWVV
jgi:hypothetical protein